MNTIGRLLNMGTNPAAMNMAIDEAILLAQQEQPNPTLRFYEWSSPAFSFGYFQDIASEVDVAACRADGIELVKRMTGGGTVVHGWELTYTLVLPRAAAEMGISEAYRCIGHSLVKAFQKLGVPAQCYAVGSDSCSAVRNRTYPAEDTSAVRNPIYPAEDTSAVRNRTYQTVGNRTYQTEANIGSAVRNRTYPGEITNAVRNHTYPGEITNAVGNHTYPAEANICLTNPAEHDVMSGDRKLAGVSVRRNRNGMMFQGYISLDMPPPFILARVSKDVEVQQSVREKSTAINVDGRFVTRDALIQAVSETFEVGIAFNLGELSPTECTQAESLVETKYATAAWNFG